MPKREVTTHYYEFRQNNSGGRWDNDPGNGIGFMVWIEAMSPSHANERAESIGIYFDGCDRGRDCSCCGDRWSRAREYDAHEEVPIERYLPNDGKGENFNYSSYYNGEKVYIHQIDGPFSVINIGLKP